MALIDTGLNTQTGGRLKRVRPHIGDDTFLMTYGDGGGDIDISALVRFHQSHGFLATITAVRPLARFGSLNLAGTAVEKYQEKAPGESGWINAGFFVLSPKALDRIKGDETLWEREPLEHLSSSGQLQAYRHEGFWQPMDTLRDKLQLSRLWEQGNAPWKIW